MSIHTVSLDDNATQPPERQLDAVELRVIGSLLEKQQTTPEYYPMTVNAILAACNQKSNREPVMELAEGQVWDALDRLRDERYVRELRGARAARWEQLVDYRWHLDRPAKALITLLLLRGAQTIGELRGRCERMHEFATTESVEEKLRELADRSRPIVRELPRRSGQKEVRWIHLLGEVSEEPAASNEASPLAVVAGVGESLASRIDRLERTVAELRDELQALKQKLGE